MTEETAAGSGRISWHESRRSAALDVASKPSDLDLPGYRTHPLKGEREGYWSVSVSGNWRIVFRIWNGDVYDVDLVDYH